MRKQRGNTLFNFLLTFFVVIVVGGWLYKSSAIDEGAANQISDWVENVKGTEFEKKFRDTVAEKMQDGKVTNAELGEISEMYTLFVLAKSQGGLDELAAKLELENIKVEQEKNDFNEAVYPWVMLILGSIFFLIVMLFGLKQITKE